MQSCSQNAHILFQRFSTGVRVCLGNSNRRTRKTAKRVRFAYLALLELAHDDQGADPAPVGKVIDDEHG